MRPLYIASPAPPDPRLIRWAMRLLLEPDGVAPGWLGDLQDIPAGRAAIEVGPFNGIIARPPHREAAGTLPWRAAAKVGVNFIIYG